MTGAPVLLITGSTGIAAATARLAATQGWKLFVTSRTTAHCEKLARETGASFLAADLTESEAASAVLNRCLEIYGRLDALYNVAGISGRRSGDGPVHECTDEGWDATMDANVKSMFRMCRAAVTLWLGRQAPGTILNMTSVLAFSPESRYFATHAYAASKGAIIAMTKAMASYYARHGIRVNAIAPALVGTPMSRRAADNPEIMKFMKTKQPLLGKMIEAEDVARASLFLLGPESKPITGAVLTADAGWSVTG